MRVDMAHSTESAVISAAGDSTVGSNTIMFDVSKNEQFTIRDEFKILYRILKTDWKVLLNKDAITYDAISQAKIFIVAGPRAKFTETEFNHMKSYIHRGGSLLVLLGEGGEQQYGTNINFLIEEYGISINNDSVISTSYIKYFNPKECMISNGILNRALGDAVGKSLPAFLADDIAYYSSVLTYVYPFGATLNVAKPAAAVMSTGSIGFPVNRPTCCFYTDTKSNGKIAVLGSVYMLSDGYIEKEENVKIQEIVFQFLSNPDFQLHQIDANDPEISDYNMLPDTALMSERTSVCLLESDEIPTDYTRLFEDKTYSVDTSMLPKTIRSYETLGVKHEPLALITPNFESPLPPLVPAVFPPSFRELSYPKVELFDLDEAFSSEQARLAQVTNKCTTDDDLNYYVKECGEILGVLPKLPSANKDPKHILEYIMMQVVEFKKLNQDEEDEETDSMYATPVDNDKTPRNPTTPTSGQIDVLQLDDP